MSLRGSYIIAYLSPCTAQVTAVSSCSQNTLLQHEENMSNFTSCWALVSRKYGQQLFHCIQLRTSEIKVVREGSLVGIGNYTTSGTDVRLGNSFWTQAAPGPVAHKG